MKKIILISTLLVLLCASLASAQTLDWTRQFGSSGFEFSTGVSADSSGNSYNVGFTAGVLTSADAQPQSSAGFFDAFVQKRDSAGTEIWTRQFGSAANDFANDISTDSSGNSYVVGGTIGTLSGETSSGGTDAFVQKRDSAGNIVFTDQFGTSGLDIAQGISADSSGNIYLAGRTGGTLPGQTSAGGFDAFLQKRDSAGNIIWTRQFGTSALDVATEVSVDSSGNSYVVGITQGSLSGPNLGNFDAFVRKYDSAGTVVWTRQFGTSAFDQLTGVAVDGSGNAYVAGFTTGSLSGPNLGNLDAIVRKYDSAGNVVWTRQFGTTGADNAIRISADSFGNSYVAGSTAGTLPGESSAGGTDAFVQKRDSAGNVVFTDQFGTSANDQAQGVAVDASAKIYLAGLTQGSLAGPNLGNFDAFARKYSQVLCTDADNDGFAIEGGTCGPVDCNDGNDTINPGASEVCNGIDDNCDGVVPSTELDGDGDGFRGCAGDCNDANAAINPAALEIPGNTVDEDCAEGADCAEGGGHGDCIQCTAHVLQGYVDTGLLTPKQKGELVKAAATSAICAK